MTDKFHQGDEVEWKTLQGTTHGRVIRKLTREMHVKGHKDAASEDNPEYLVESDRSDQQAEHKAKSLRKRGGS